MPNNIEPRSNSINNKVNTVVGLKQYQQVKKVMKEFDPKLSREQAKAPKIDQRIK